MKKYPWQHIIWITFFAIAMGFLETSVVVYLRELYYPAGFEFPLTQMPVKLALTEIFREAATIIMLVGAGYLAGRTFITRFGYFIYAFAVWDIFYYVFLKIILNWPQSLFTWDILFLIPVAWVGPVLSPVISSFTMILLFFIIIEKNKKIPGISFDWKIWSLLITGSAITIISWTLDYLTFIHVTFPDKSFFSIPAKDILDISNKYVPQSFNWWIFSLGEAVILYAIWKFWVKKQ